MKQTPLKRHTPLRTYSKLKAKKQGLRRVAHSTKPPTEEESARFAAMRAIGCLACRFNGMHGLFVLGRRHTPFAGKLEIHHILSGGRRIGHEATICLCQYHHQGKWLPSIEVGYTVQSRTFGPSLEREPNRFREVYGAELALLKLQNELLAVREGLLAGKPFA